VPLPHADGVEQRAHALHFSRGPTASRIPQLHNPGKANSAPRHLFPSQPPSKRSTRGKGAEHDRCSCGQKNSPVPRALRLHGDAARRQGWGRRGHSETGLRLPAAGDSAGILLQKIIFRELLASQQRWGLADSCHHRTDTAPAS